MSRPPRFSLFRPLVLGVLVTVVVGGCGKGLYTRAGQFRDPDGSGGGVIDPGTGSGGGTGGATSPDAYVPPDSEPIKPPDAASKPDVTPGSSTTQAVSSGSNAEIRHGDATLTIPKDSIPIGGTYRVTLALVRNDGTLSLENGDGTTQEYGGTIGPIYSITADFVLRGTATLKIHVIPDASIPPQRVGLAYVNEPSKAWILAPGSAYDSVADEVTGTVTNPSGTRYFAPVETCAKEGQDGGTCRLGLKCNGEACQS